MTKTPEPPVAAAILFTMIVLTAIFFTSLIIARSILKETMRDVVREELQSY